MSVYFFAMWLDNRVWHKPTVSFNLYIQCLSQSYSSIYIIAHIYYYNLKIYNSQIQFSNHKYMHDSIVLTSLRACIEIVPKEVSITVKLLTKSRSARPPLFPLVFS